MNTTALKKFFSKISHDYLLLYLFFLSVTGIRFILEAMVSRFVEKKILFFHHHYWFLFVFLLFLLNFKVFLNAENRKIVWTAYLSPVIFIPILYNQLFLGGETMLLNYLSPLDPSTYFKNIFTFMYFSDVNRAQSVELLLIVISIAVFSYYNTRNILRSLLCAISCYLSMIFLAATVFFAPGKPDFALIVVNSNYCLQTFMAFQFFTLSLIAGLIIFRKELLMFFDSRKKWMLMGVISLLFFISVQVLLDSPTLLDRVFIMPHSLLTAISFLVIFYVKNWKTKTLFITQYLFSFGIIYFTVF